MPDCRHTGLSVPECSCRSCLEAQLALHQPELLARSAQAAPAQEAAPALAPRDERAA